MLTAILVAAGLQCGAPARADLAGCERLLREGEIVSREDVGEGVTGAIRLRLRLGGDEAHVLLDADWRPVAIDNSIAFHPFLKPYRPLYCFPRGPLAALRALEPRVLRERMKGLLEKDELAGLLARRDRVLELAKEAEARDPAAALFDW